MTGNRFVGTTKLLRLILRLDRVKLSLWLIGLITLVAVTPFSLRAVLDAEAKASGITTEEVLTRQAALLETNSASIALQGPPDALDTFGGRYAFEIGAFSLAIVAVMNILLIARHTRAEEESGRADLVRAASVGPWSSLAAVGIVAIGANVVLGLAATVVFVADGRAVWASLLYGSSIATCGVLFGAMALVWVQVFEYGRAATGMSLASLGVAFALRAVGDARGNWVSLLSPLGWVQAVDAFGEAKRWPLALSAMGLVAMVAVAIGLAARRDVGAALIEQRRGPPTATAALVTPLGFAWRIQRSALVSWTFGAAFVGAIYGSVISEIDDFIEENESMRDMLESMGMTGDSLRDGFVTVILSMVALIGMAGVIQSQLRPRVEENAGRAEPVIASAISRRNWLGSHVALTAMSAPTIMLAAGVGLSVADALVVGHFTDFGGTIGAALTRVPALWATAGLGVFLYGWARQFALGVWAAFTAAAVIFLFGDLLRLPDAVTNLSPIGHVTHLPGDGQSWVSIAVLCAVGALTAASGIVLFGRRDVSSG